MRRPRTALGAAVVAAGLSVPVVFVYAQQFARGTGSSSDPNAASAVDPSLLTRSPRTLLRNGLDYIGYKDYTRALRFLRAAEAAEDRAAKVGQVTLDGDEVRSLKQGILQAQAGLREPASSDMAGRLRRPGALAIARPVAPAPESRSGDGIQLAATELPAPVAPPPTDSIAPPAVDTMPPMPGSSAPLPAPAPIPTPEATPIPVADRESSVARPSADPSLAGAAAALPEPEGRLPEPAPAPTPAAVTDLPTTGLDLTPVATPVPAPATPQNPEAAPLPAPAVAEPAPAPSPTADPATARAGDVELPPLPIQPTARPAQPADAAPLPADSAPMPTPTPEPTAPVVPADPADLPADLRPRRICPHRRRRICPRPATTASPIASPAPASAPMPESNAAGTRPASTPETPP